MKYDLNQQHVHVTDRLKQVNSKIDNIYPLVNELKTENPFLRRETNSLKSEIASLHSKIDTLEAHSRRNNLRIDGWGARRLG